MTPQEQFEEVKLAINGAKIPRNEDLALLKIKEILQVDNSDINKESRSCLEFDDYYIRYQNISIHVQVDYYNKRLRLDPHYDVYDETDSIVACF